MKSLQDSSGKLALVASLVVPAVMVLAFLILMISLRNGLEASLADLSVILPVGYAFGAGMVASVNPCGFFLLPSYMSYHLGTTEEGFYSLHPARRMLRALLLGGLATMGFVLFFGIVGAAIAFGGTWLVEVFPYTGISVGIGLVLLGIWLLFTRRHLTMPSLSTALVTPRRNTINIFLFGIGYALASLSCTLPIFLVVVGSSLASDGFVTSMIQFIGYSLGMGTILVSITIGIAFLKGAVSGWLRWLLPHVSTVSALFLVGAGVYLILYWLLYSGFFL